MCVQIFHRRLNQPRRQFLFLFDRIASCKINDQFRKDQGNENISSQPFPMSLITQAANQIFTKRPVIDRNAQHRLQGVQLDRSVRIKNFNQRKIGPFKHRQRSGRVKDHDQNLEIGKIGEGICRSRMNNENITFLQ